MHEGLAALVAYRFGLTEPNTFSTAANDYGFEVLSKKQLEIGDNMSSIFSAKGLLEDLCEAINSSQMSKKQFREIARVTGLIIRELHGSVRQAGNKRYLISLCTMSFSVMTQRTPCCNRHCAKS